MLEHSSTRIRSVIMLLAVFSVSACGGLSRSLQEGSSRQSDATMVQVQGVDNTVEMEATTSSYSGDQSMSQVAQPMPTQSQPGTPEPDSDTVTVALRNIVARLDEQAAEIAGLREMIDTKSPSTDVRASIQRMETLASRTETLAGRLEALETRVRDESIIRDAVETRPAGPFSRDGSAGQGRTFYGLHLGSFEKIEALRPAWNDAVGKYPGALGAFDAYFSQLDVEGVGVYYRLVAGPLNSRDEARQACQPILDVGGYCRVTELAGEKVPL